MRERCKVVATNLNHALRIRNENDLVHVALVALVGFELLDVGVGFVD